MFLFSYCYGTLAVDELLLLLLFPTEPCVQQDTSACDDAVMMVACRGLNMALRSGASLPQHCQNVLSPP